LYLHQTITQWVTLKPKSKCQQLHCVTYGYRVPRHFKGKLKVKVKCEGLLVSMFAGVFYCCNGNYDKLFGHYKL